MIAGRIWAVVLAGGDGERLRPLTERWLGHHVPKQYCTFAGTRTMLEHTLDRAVQLAAPERVVTVMARAHASYPLRPHPALDQGRVVLQPANRDTAPGVLLALAYVAAVDPNASVVVLPSDHFVQPCGRFVRQVREALWAARALDRLVLVGVAPRGLELDYGWIQPGGALDHDRVSCRARAVERFVEKPGPVAAGRLRDEGALWNTMVMAGSLRKFWMLGRKRTPDLAARYELLAAGIGTRHESAILDDIYSDMPRRNFSADILGPSAAALAVLELGGVSWSDWGTADRIMATLEDLGELPAFAGMRDRLPS